MCAKDRYRQTGTIHTQPTHPVRIQYLPITAGGVPVCGANDTGNIEPHYTTLASAIYTFNCSLQLVGVG